MKDARQVNKTLLTEWAAFQLGADARAQLSIEARVSVSLINQMFCGRCPGEKSRLRICKVIGIEQDQLFPLILRSERESA